MKMIFASSIILSFCFFTVLTLGAQKNFWNSPDAYIGQTQPGDTPKIFAPELLAQADTFSLDRVAFSNDGKEFYYNTNDVWFDTKDTKTRYFIYKQGAWKGPFVLNAHYYAPTFSVNGNTLYFLGGKGDSLHDFVWQSKRTVGAWTEPALYLKNDHSLYDFMPTNSGTAYVGSNVGGKMSDLNSYDICELKISAKGTTIKSLGPPINTPGFESDFFVARDESYIILSTKETKDLECELWISFHKPDKTWSKPVTLGPLINNDIAHRWGQYVTPDGKFLFYSYGHSPKDCHVVWVRFDHLLQKLMREELSN